MREATIVAFLKGDVTAEFLNNEALKSIEHHDAVASSIHVIDMDQPFTLSRTDIIKLCNAGIDETLSADALNAIAFSLIATDQFDWDGDDLISEVLHDWSAPEINYPLTPSNLLLNKSWLLGIGTLPQRPPLPQQPRGGRLVSLRTKAPEEKAGH
jgi:hypothetical protein